MKIEAFKISEILLKICVFQSVYTLNVSGYAYTGANVGDDLSYHSGYAFSTYDQDNDISSGNCAQIYDGAWWYKYCYKSNLNGLNNGDGNSASTGIKWNDFSSYSLKTVYMAIKAGADDSGE